MVLHNLWREFQLVTRRLVPALTTYKALSDLVGYKVWVLDICDCVCEQCIVKTLLAVLLGVHGMAKTVAGAQSAPGSGMSESGER